MPVPYLKEHEEHVKRNFNQSFWCLTIKGPLGELFVQQCVECPEYRAECLHAYNSWNKECTILSCLLCGADGT